MKAYQITKTNNNNTLKLISTEIPVPGEDEVLIKVMAAGVNRADLFQVEGKYPLPTENSNIPGLEVSGIVKDVGRNVRNLLVGDKVCALLIGGGYAEYAVVHQSLLLPVPNNCDLIEAASLPEALFTVWLNLFEKAKLLPHETLLIHGGASGIGTMAIQLAKGMGAKVIVTVSSDDKSDLCYKLGADLVINYNKDDFVSKIAKFTEQKGVDVVLDMFGGEFLDKNLQLLADNGRMAIIGFLKGSQMEINAGSILTKNLTIFGCTLRSQDLVTKARIGFYLKDKIYKLFEENKIRPVIDQIYPLEKVEEAHKYMMDNKHKGKIVLRID